MNDQIAVMLPKFLKSCPTCQCGPMIMRDDPYQYKFLSEQPWMQHITVKCDHYSYWRLLPLSNKYRSNLVILDLINVWNDNV